MRDRILQQFLLTRRVSTDTRHIEQGSIFFALKGTHFNGNRFAQQALDAGASLVVVDEEVDTPSDRTVRVNDALEALQALSHDYRRTFQIPFLAITGSNGKTTTKELVREVLAMKFKVHATTGNLNNHIGVPLTLLMTPADCEFAVIEMGANHQHEIAGYCQYAEPGFGLITNIGKAHLEGFGGEEGVKKGKRELYDYVFAKGGKVFVNVELPVLDEISKGMDRLEYGFSVGSFRLGLVKETPQVVYGYSSDSFSAEVDTHLAGGYNLYNIASAIAVGRYFGVHEGLIHRAISNYYPDNNRSQLTRTTHNRLILDAYNANPSSMDHALRSLSKQQEKKKFFVLGDMRELGDHSAREHELVLQQAKALGLKGITVGPWFKSMEKEFGFPSFETNEEARKYLEELELEDHLVLIKGSRGIKLEEVVSAL